MRDMKTIVLASASPRRKEIMKKTGLRFKVDESGYEEIMDGSLKPRELAKSLSREKARDVARRHKNALIIAADTIVVFKGKLFGKPSSEQEAKEMLKTLSGGAHTVITGYTVLDTNSRKEISKSVQSKVFFKKLNELEIMRYIKSGEPLDKAGAYGVQGLGAVIVKRIEGDFFNVMGLPLSALAESLREFGIRVP